MYKVGPSNNATLFAKKMWPQQRGGLWGEGDLNAFTVLHVAAIVLPRTEVISAERD